jgi:hypothetical protein
MTIEELVSFGRGDVIILSDIQSQLDADDLTQELVIQDIRKYTGPDGLFEYTGYLANGRENLRFMVMVKVVGDKHEIYVYYLETDGKLYGTRDNREDCALLELFDDELDDLRERIEATIITGDVEDDYREITWDKQEIINGVHVVGDGDEGVCTLGEYYTGDDNEGNNYALIDLRGEPEDGYLEIWYGCPIKDHEIEFLRVS